MKTLKIPLGAEPLCLRDTLDCGQAFRWRENADGSFSGIVGGRGYTVSLLNGDLCISPKDGKSADITFWKKYFALDISYEKLQAGYSENPVLAECVAFAPGIRVLRQDFFETLISFLISQNNNIPRIKAIIERLCDNFGDSVGDEPLSPEPFKPEECAQELEIGGRKSFPSPEKIASLNVEDLAPLRAGYRAEFILRTARAFVENPGLADEIVSAETSHARELLLKLHGVGPKVADCVLLFGLGRFEAFPVDVWIRRAMAALFPEGLPASALSTAGIAQQYIFNYARSSGKLK